MLLSFVVTVALAATAREGAGPVIGSPAPVVDLGDVYQGDTKRTQFVVENRGDEPLGLFRVVPRCGCTIAKLRLSSTGEEKVIPMISGAEPFLELGPGEKCEILVDFNSSGQPLHQITKEIDVESTDPKQPRFKLKLEINLLRVAHFEPQLVQFGKVMVGTPATSKVEVWPGEGVDFEIAEIKPIEHVKTEVTKEELPNGRKRYRIALELLPTAPIGDFSRTLHIQTSIATAPPIKISLFALVQPTVRVDTGNRFNNSAVDFGVVQAGKGGEASFLIENGRPETPYVPQKVTIDSQVAQHLVATIEEVEAGVRYRVRVVADAQLNQKFFKGMFTVISEHPEAQKLVVPFQGLVK